MLGVTNYRPRSGAVNDHAIFLVRAVVYQKDAWPTNKIHYGTTFRDNTMKLQENVPVQAKI